MRAATVRPSARAPCIRPGDKVSCLIPLRPCERAWIAPYSAPFDDLFMEQIGRNAAAPVQRPIVTPFFGQGSFATYSVVHRSSAVKVDRNLISGCSALSAAASRRRRASSNILKPRPERPSRYSGRAASGCRDLAARAAGCAPIAPSTGLTAPGLAKELGATHSLNTIRAGIS